MQNADHPIFSLAAAAALGAAAMYVLNPIGGRRRRAIAYDKISETGRNLRRSAAVTARDLGNRSGGVVAQARAPGRQG